MDLEKALKKYPFILDDIKKLNEEIKTLTEIKYDTNITTSFESTGGGRSSNISDKTLDQVIQIEELYDRRIESITKKIARSLNDKEKVDEALDSLDYLPKQIVELRYFKRETWDYIAVTTNNSSRNCQYIMKKAMGKLRDFF